MDYRKQKSKVWSTIIAFQNYAHCLKKKKLALGVLDVNFAQFYHDGINRLIKTICSSDNVHTSHVTHRN